MSKVSEIVEGFKKNLVHWNEEGRISWPIASSVMSFIDVLMRENKDELATLRTQLAELQEEVSDWESSFDLYDKAARRGIAMWQEKTGKTHQWPDTGHLICYLIEQLAQADEDREVGALIRVMCAHRELSLDRRRTDLWVVFDPNLGESIGKGSTAIAALQAAQQGNGGE